MIYRIQCLQEAAEVKGNQKLCNFLQLSVTLRKLKNKRTIAEAVETIF